MAVSFFKTCTAANVFLLMMAWVGRSNKATWVYGLQWKSNRQNLRANTFHTGSRWYLRSKTPSGFVGYWSEASLLTKGKTGKRESQCQALLGERHSGMLSPHFCRQTSLARFWVALIRDDTWQMTNEVTSMHQVIFQDRAKSPALALPSTGPLKPGNWLMKVMPKDTKTTSQLPQRTQMSWVDVPNGEVIGLLVVNHSHFLKLQVSALISLNRHLRWIISISLKGTCYAFGD